ncbi:MAG TPA: hypothetical protein VFH68_07615 [Polyangia bacterium]|nr:hypothetical protein [Polyangia bacterium]
MRAPACDASVFSFPSFLELLRVELAGTRFQCCDVVGAGPAWPPPAAVMVDVSAEPCDAQRAVVWLRIDDPARRRGAHRGVPIGELAAAARPRALALLAAELLRTTDDEAREQHGALAGAATARAPGRPVLLQDPPTLDAEGELRGYPKSGLILAGLRLGLVAPLGARVILAGDLGAMIGEQSFAIGSARLLAGTAGLSAGARWSPGDIVAASVGARVEGGWAELRGDAFNGALIASTSRWSPIADVAAWAAVERPSRTWLRARIVAQVGTMLRGLVADVGGTSTAGMSGPFWSIAAGLVLAPWR